MTPFTQRPLTALSQRRSMSRLAMLAGIFSVGLACSSANNPGSTSSSAGGAAGNPSYSGGSGGAGGSAGQTSGNGCATSSLVVPSLESGSTRYDFTWGDFVFKVDPYVGARVTTLSLGGTNIITHTVPATTTQGRRFGRVHNPLGAGLHYRRLTATLTRPPLAAATSSRPGRPTRPWVPASTRISRRTQPLTGLRFFIP